MSNQLHEEDAPVTSRASIVILKASHGPETSKLQFKSPKTPPSGNKLRQAIRVSKRRIIQQLLVKLRQAEVSDDSEYQTLRARQEDLYTQVIALMTQIKSFATTVVAMGHGASTIGDTALSISTATPQQKTNKSSMQSIGSRFDTEFPKSMHKLEHSARELSSTILSTLIKNLEKKLDALITLKKEMEDRENLKLDFDSAIRKLRKAKANDKPEDIARREVKLQMARHALTNATENIIKQFLHYEQARTTMILTELQQFRELQTTFFALCVASFQSPQRSFDDEEEEEEEN